LEGTIHVRVAVVKSLRLVTVRTKNKNGELHAHAKPYCTPVIYTFTIE